MSHANKGHIWNPFGSCSEDGRWIVRAWHDSQFEIPAALRGKLDVSNRLDDGFREAGADINPLAPGVECLLVDRNEDEALQQFVERCRKKLRKAKDEAAQAMVLALLVSDACGRSGVHASDLQARHAELVAGQRRTTGVLLLGDLLGDVAASPARNSRSRTGAALSERAILQSRSRLAWHFRLHPATSAERIVQRGQHQSDALRRRPSV